MAKGLKGVIRLRKWDVDEKRRALAVLLEQEAQIVQAMADLEARVVAEGEAAARDAAGTGRTLGAFLILAKEQRQRLELMLAEIRTSIELAQDAVAEAFKEFKTFEIAQANRDENERKERERKDQIVMDELGVEIFRRRDSSSTR